MKKIKKLEIDYFKIKKVEPYFISLMCNYIYDY